MKILVTGSREWPLSRAGVISRFLDKFAERSTDGIHLIHGACPYGRPSDSPYKGVDGHAHAHAVLRGWRVQPVPPEPSEGRTWLVAKDFAIRNQLMVDMLPDMVIAFPLSGQENRGTAMTIEMAEKKKLYIVEVKG